MKRTSGRVAAPVVALLLAACGATAAPIPPQPPVPSAVPAATAATTPVQAPAWTTYHDDVARTGVDTTSPAMGAPRILWRSAALDGAVYAEPLLIGGRVIVATENDSLYSLDARSGAVAWHTNLGAPVPRAQLPCGDIFPLGITGTPVIDRAAQAIEAVTETAGGQHTLVSLDLGTGRVRWRRVIDPSGMVTSTEQERAALTIANGRIYIAFGGLYGDCGAYHGWVVGVATDGSGPLLDYKVPSGREAGIWATAGPVVEPGGTLLVATGNSEAVTTPDGGNAVIRLSPDLKPLAEWYPPDWAVLNAGDHDVGSISPSLLGSDLLFQGGKSGQGYLLRAGALTTAFSAAVCPSGSYGGTAFASSLLDVPCITGLRALRIGPGATFSVAWTGPSTGPPIIAGGAVWAVAFGQSTLYAFDPATGAVRARIDVGPTVHFTTPASLDGTLVVAAGSTIVAVTGV